MFSRALFRQSCKANKIMWTIITFAVCFMLASVMLISGDSTLGEIRYGIQDTIIEGQLDNQIKSLSISYYNNDTEGLTEFDDAFKTAYAQDPDTAVAVAVEQVQTYFSQKYSEDAQNAQEAFGVFVLSLKLGIGQDKEDRLYKSLSMLGEDTSPYDVSGVFSQTDEERLDYIEEFAKNRMSQIISVNMISEDSIQSILDSLKNYGVDYDKYQSYSYDVGQESVSRYTGASGYNYIKDLSQKTIISFAVRVKYEIENGKTRVQAIKEVYGALTETFLSTLPQKVSSAIEEIGALDLYGLIVGSVFYKMAGLLLPIIYMIMVANNLIAGQVDSGSMAYVLSTGTKRKQVVFTQAVFLVGSLLAMFICTTITGVICLSIVKSDVITLSYGKLILLNVGAFLSMFAMSGIAFFASCWFNRSKHSMAIGGGLNMFFLVATMLGLFGSKVLPSIIRLKALNFFNYVSVISLFDSVSILNGGFAFVWKLAILLIIGIVFFVLGAIKFRKKDLPL